MHPRVLLVLVVLTIALLLGALGAWLLLLGALRPVAGPLAAPLIASTVIGGALLGARALLDRRSPPRPPAGEG